MKKDLELWQFIAEHLRQKQSVTLLVVAESSGSSPGRKSFKMAVAEDELLGSVGGGVMEVDLVERVRSQSYVSGSEPEVVKQVHRKDAPNSSGMICSGEQTIILIELNDEHLEMVRKIISALEKHQPCRLRISNLKFEVSAYTSQDSDFRFEQTGENEFLFEEKLGCKNKLFVVGGGHCALALSALMSKMDFRITLFDDRPNLNTLTKNEFVHQIEIIKSYDHIDEYIASGEDHYVVVMTLGYKFDEIVIRRLFDKNFRYFGVLGSKAKMVVLLRNLTKEGFDKEKLDQIHTPVGLGINSRTPEEIAVSIAAEIISVKNAHQ